MGSTRIITITPDNPDGTKLGWIEREFFKLDTAAFIAKFTPFKLNNAQKKMVKLFEDRADNHEQFDGRVKYINRLETVSPDKCDRCHNKKKYSRAILPIAKLCTDCQRELEL